MNTKSKTIPYFDVDNVVFVMRLSRIVILGIAAYFALC